MIILTSQTHKVNVLTNINYIELGARTRTKLKVLLVLDLRFFLNKHDITDSKNTDYN